MVSTKCKILVLYQGPFCSVLFFIAMNTHIYVYFFFLSYHTLNMYCTQTPVQNIILKYVGLYTEYLYFHVFFPLRLYVRHFQMIFPWYTILYQSVGRVIFRDNRTPTFYLLCTALCIVVIWTSFTLDVLEILPWESLIQLYRLVMSAITFWYVPKIFIWTR